MDVLVNQFHGNIHSKTLSCRKIKISFFTGYVSDTTKKKSNTVFVSTLPARDRLKTSESDVYRRYILTSIVT